MRPASRELGTLHSAPMETPDPAGARASGVARVARWTLACICVTAACGDGRPAGSGTGAAPDEPSIDELAAIGYTEFDDASAGDERDGVVLHVRERATPGYTLFTSIPHAITVLVDAEGEAVRSWEFPAAIQTPRAELLPDGDLLVIGSDGDPKRPRAYLERVDWHGNRVWRRDIDAHHDVELTPDGRIAVLTQDPRDALTVEGPRKFRNDFVTLLTANGRDLFDQSIVDTVRSGPAALELAHQPDLFHTNSIAFQPFPELEGEGPLYAAHNVLVSMRNQDAVAILDTRAREMLWVWGPGELIRQHEATWLPSGNVLLFDNGGDARDYSRLVEVDPRSDAIVWEYRADPPEAFYSEARGIAQALPGGNVFVAESNSGALFEVTREGEVVWEYLNPLRDDQGRRGAVRGQRYPVPFVEAILERVR